MTSTTCWRRVKSFTRFLRDYTRSRRQAGARRSHTAPLLEQLENRLAPATTANISGAVFFDIHGDGVFRADDPGLAGKTVFLDLHNDGTLHSDDPSAVTDANGAYTIANVTAGSYTVRQNLVFGNITLTGGAAKGVAAQVAGSPVTGVNFGMVVFAPAAPVAVNGDIFGASNPDANTAYVRGLYQAILGRPSRADEVPFWLNKINNGFNQIQVVQGFIQSFEHRGMEIDYYYSNFLHRAPSPAERAFMIDMYLKGATETAVVENFLNSADYQAAHPGNDQFAQSVYADLLGRTPSTTEAAAVQSQLQAGKARAQLVDTLLHTDEANKLAVQGFYAAYLHRNSSADPNSVYWTNTLATGVSLGDVQGGVVGDLYFGEFFKAGATTVH
jgi:SdrD B-like domain/Domain of unknown function (DUF4214)